MAAVPYKLIPLSVYQDITDGNCSESLTAATADFHQKNQQHQLNLNENHEKGSQRTIGEIQKKMFKILKKVKAILVALLKVNPPPLDMEHLV